MALIAGRQGDTAAARRYNDESLAIAHETNDRVGMLVAALGQTDSAMTDKDYERGRSLGIEVLRLGRELGMAKDWTHGLEICAYCSLHLSGPEKAARLYGALERIREETGEPRSPSELGRQSDGIAEIRAAFADAAGGDPAIAAAAFEAAWEEGRQLTRDKTIDHALAPESPAS